MVFFSRKGQYWQNTLHGVRQFVLYCTNQNDSDSRISHTAHIYRKCYDGEVMAIGNVGFTGYKISL